MFNQNEIISNIYNYLISRNRGHLAEKLPPGYCRAIEQAFKYFAHIDKLELLEANLTYVQNWQDDVNTIARVAKYKQQPRYLEISELLSERMLVNPNIIQQSVLDQLTELKALGQITQADIQLYMAAMLPDDVILEKIINLLNWLQASIRDTDLAGKLNAIRNKDPSDLTYAKYKFKPSQFEYFGVIKKAHLMSVLENIIPNSFNDLGTGLHAFAIQRRESEFIYCDANCGIIFFTNAQLLADHIISTVYEEVVSDAIPFSIVTTARIELDNDKLNELQECLLHAETLDQVCAPPSSYSLSGITPLVMVINYGQEKAISALIEKASFLELSKISCNDLSVAHLIARDSGTSPSNLHALLEKGIPVDYKLELPEILWGYQYTYQGATLLHMACLGGKIEIVKILVEKGASLDAKTVIGITPIMFAATRGHLEIVEYLFAHKASLDEKVDIACTKQMPLNIDINHEEKHFLAGALMNYELYDGMDAILFAASYNNFEVALKLLEHKPKTYNPKTKGFFGLIHYAVLKNNLWAVRQLLERTRVDVNRICYKLTGNEDSINPLWIACFITNNIAMIKFLIKHGANLELCSNKDEIINLLLDNRNISSENYITRIKILHEEKILKMSDVKKIIEYFIIKEFYFELAYIFADSPGCPTVESEKLPFQISALCKTHIEEFLPVSKVSRLLSTLLPISKEILDFSQLSWSGDAKILFDAYHEMKADIVNWQDVIKSILKAKKENIQPEDTGILTIGKMTFFLPLHMEYQTLISETYKIVEESKSIREFILKYQDLFIESKDKIPSQDIEFWDSVGDLLFGYIKLCNKRDQCAAIAKTLDKWLPSSGALSHSQ